MKQLLIVLLLSVYATTLSQNSGLYSDLELKKFSSLFKEIEVPFCSKGVDFKNSCNSDNIVDSISSKNILMLGDDDLYYEDLVWDLDSEEEGATKLVMVESFPRAQFKILTQLYTAYFVFSRKDSEMSGDSEWWSKMYTFDKNGVFVDSITVYGSDFDGLNILRQHS